MIRAPKSLASRLTIWYAAVFVFFCGAAFILFWYSIDVVLDRKMDEDLEEDIAEFRLLFRSEGLERVITEINREAGAGNAEDVFLRLLTAEGWPIHESDLSRWQGVTLDGGVLERITEGAGPLFETLEMEDGGDEKDARVVAGLIADGVVLQIGESLEDKEEFMELLRNIFGTTFAVVIGLAALVGWVMARQALRGVEEVSRAAVDIAEGTLDRRVSVKAKGEEIERLAATFNAMVDRLRALIAGMREMTDNIAHDLRSPLARIRANAEVALSSAKTIEEHKTAAADTLEECDRLLHMINSTLDVAEAEVGVSELKKEPVDLSRIVRDACELFEPLAEDKQIRLSVELEPDCRVKGNTQYLQRMLANLLDNALKYTEPRGEVSTALSSSKERVEIAVRDTGIGIATEDQHRVFDRFFRCDQSRSRDGCGMGLSFARAIARAHGGDITLTSAPGTGSEFTVTLPL